MGRVDPDLVDHGLVARLRQHVASPAAGADLRTYYGPDSTYDGRRYDELGVGDPDRFTAEDVVAVSSLSVPIPIAYSWRLLRDDADSLNELLRQIPRRLDLWDAGDGVVGPGSPADRLWQCLNSFGKYGGDDGDAWVTAGKLLARKRPRLIPIYDNRVRDLVSLRSSRASDGEQRRASWWYSLRAALVTKDQLGQTNHADPEDHAEAGNLRPLCELIDEVKTKAEIEAPISTLRALDVILWMEASRRARPEADIDQSSPSE